MQTALSKSWLATKTGCSILVIANMVTKSPVDAEVARVARGLKILSVETRLRIIQLLRNRSLCVGALTCQLGLTQGAVSQHLKVLRDTGFVIAQRQGNFVHYRVSEDALAQWRNRIDELLTATMPPNNAGRPEGASPSATCRKQEEEPCAARRIKTSARRTRR